MLVDLLQEAAGRTNDKISIIVPCYNREKYIRPCLDSILAQTLPLQMLEIILVDDCSTDHTPEILKEYEAKYPDNILLVQCEKNSTGYVGIVRNIGMSYASGSYITFVDSDDLIEPTLLEKLYTKAVLYHADIVDCGHKIFRGSEVCGVSNKIERFYQLDNPQEKKYLFMTEGVEGTVWGKLYDAHFLKEHNILFPEDQHIGEDSLFHGISLFFAKRFYCLPELLYDYRLNDEGIWNSDKTTDFILDAFHTQEKLYDYYLRYGQDVKQEYEWAFYGAVFSMRQKCISMGREDVFEKHLPYIKMKLAQLLPDLKDNPYIYHDQREINTVLLKKIFDT